jgi:uncharacterized protein (TIGR02611 family)
MKERTHAYLSTRPWLRRAYRAGIAAVGVLIIVIGIILIPLPGPGWLIVFAGLGVLGTEFAWAHRVTAGVKRLFRRALDWARSRRRASRRSPASGD